MPDNVVAHRRVTRDELRELLANSADSQFVGTARRALPALLDALDEAHGFLDLIANPARNADERRAIAVTALARLLEIAP